MSPSARPANMTGPQANLFFSIIKDATNPVYYQNRALCYYRTAQYDKTQADALRAVELDPSSVKGHYYLGLALTRLGTSLTLSETHLTKAYRLSLADHSKSTVHICEAILECRKARWEHEQRARIAQSTPLLAEILQNFEHKADENRVRLERQRRNGEISSKEYGEEVEFLETDLKRKIDATKRVFKSAAADASSSSGPLAKEAPPDYLTDPISFNLFVDPVVTQSGRSYERAWLNEHLKTSSVDPFSRDTIDKDKIFPNIMLKAAAEDFIKKNGEF